MSTAVERVALEPLGAGLLLVLQVAQRGLGVARSGALGGEAESLGQLRLLPGVEFAGDAPQPPPTLPRRRFAAASRQVPSETSWVGRRSTSARRIRAPSLRASARARPMWPCATRAGEAGEAGSIPSRRCSRSPIAVVVGVPELDQPAARPDGGDDVVGGRGRRAATPCAARAPRRSSAGRRRRRSVTRSAPRRPAAGSGPSSGTSPPFAPGRAPRRRRCSAPRAHHA